MIARETQQNRGVAAQCSGPVYGASTSIVNEYGSFYYWWYYDIPTNSCHAPVKLR
jgi:hypothetical protein